MTRTYTVTTVQQGMTAIAAALKGQYGGSHMLALWEQTLREQGEVTALGSPFGTGINPCGYASVHVVLRRP